MFLIGSRDCKSRDVFEDIVRQIVLRVVKIGFFLISYLFYLFGVKPTPQSLRSVLDLSSAAMPECIPQTVKVTSDSGNGHG